MEYSGQATKYKINRPLTEEERNDQLKQKKSHPVEPHYNLSVININSTFLECTDKYYGFKGLVFLVTLIVFIMLSWHCGVSINIFLRNPIYSVADGQLQTALTIIYFFFIAIPLTWLALRESFTYTHYPIRLNRKNRMVYVFRRNGTVLSVPWDDVFFTFGRGNNYANVQNWDIRGHVLDRDRQTVLETFAFAMDDNNRDLLLRHWEFVRRYMEDGPRHLIGQIEMCLPIAQRKETLGFGITRMCANLAGVPILFWMLSPLLVLFGIGRYIAMRTCKIPRWPDWVERECAVTPDDPYVRESGYVAPRDKAAAA